MADKETEIRDSFRRQAEVCRKMDSPITAEALETAAEKLSPDTRTGTRLLHWEGDPKGSGDAVSLRLAGGLHAIARKGVDQALKAAYAGEAPVAPAVEAALTEHDAELYDWLKHPPQTNEVGRAALIMAGLHVAASRYPLPIDLLEIGSSAGLVLNCNRYRYDLGGLETGEDTSPLLLKPEWHGAPPPQADVKVVAQRGVDRNPIYLSSPEAAERLIAYVWPDQPHRIERLERAIGLARAFSPPIVAGEAADWIEKRLATQQADGILRVLFHTITLQYFSAEDRGRVERAVEQAGAQADREHPFGWLSFELNDAQDNYELRLRLWPSGENLHLANAHPHGDRVKWLV